MDKVYDNFNQAVLYIQNNPEEFNYNIPNILEIYDKKAIVPMINRNADGQRIVIIRHKIFDNCKVDLFGNTYFNGRAGNSNFRFDCSIRLL